MSRYIDADELTEFYEPYKDMNVPVNALLEQIKDTPTADVVEVGIITCFGIKFVVEDDIIKVKWRHGDKHYVAPFGGLLALWEMYKKEQDKGGEEDE